MAFKKGQSGNPGGRPKVAPEVQDLLKEYTAEAVQTLADIMRDTSAPPASRVAASLGLLRKTLPDLNSTDHTTKGEPITGVQWLGEQSPSHTALEVSSGRSTSGRNGGPS